VLFHEITPQYTLAIEQFWGRAARASDDSKESGRLLIFGGRIYGVPALPQTTDQNKRRIVKAVIATAAVMFILFGAFVYYVSHEGSEVNDTVEQFQKWDAEVQASTDAELKKSQLRIGQIVLGTDSPEMRQYAKCLDNVAILDKDKTLCRSLQEEINNRIQATHKW